MRSRGRRPLVIVDIASPRDVDPAVADLPNVFLYDLDSLESIVQQHREARAREIPKAERVVELELEHFMKWYRALQVKPTIRALRHTFEEIGQQEAERHAKHFSEAEQEALQRYTRSLINKLLHHPTLCIKTVDRSTSDGMAMLAAVQDLFQLTTSTQSSDPGTEAE
jgi:glutamyl-tRNA reductase